MVPERLLRRKGLLSTGRGCGGCTVGTRADLLRAGEEKARVILISVLREVLSSSLRSVVNKHFIKT